MARCRAATSPGRKWREPPTDRRRRPPSAPGRARSAEPWSCYCPHPVLRRSHRACACLAAIAAVGGCADVDTGVVEINWAFVDRDGEPIYPAGQFVVGRDDTCGLSGRRGNQRLRYDLHMQLSICDESCTAGCDDESCQVVTPDQFSCDVARNTARDVPASNDPYLFSMRAVIETPGKTCTDVPLSCIAVPGPRERTVERGRVVDLQVWQVVVDIDLNGDAVLDLEECDCA